MHAPLAVTNRSQEGLGRLLRLLHVACRVQIPADLSLSFRQFGAVWFSHAHVSIRAPDGGESTLGGQW